MAVMLYLCLLLKIDLQRNVCVTTVNLILILRFVVKRRNRTQDTTPGNTL